MAGVMLAALPVTAGAAASAPAAAGSPYVVDRDGDGYPVLTCGAWSNPCPSNEVLNLIDPVFEEDWDDNDATILSFCATVLQDYKDGQQAGIWIAYVDPGTERGAQNVAWCREGVE